MSSRTPSPHLRAQTYYWKCDRPAAFHGTAGSHDHASWQVLVQQIVEQHFGAPATVHPGPGQGNHITYTATCGDLALFIRMDDSPEQDDYLAVESQVQNLVRDTGVPSPLVYATDASRAHAPFAWQIMEQVQAPDLNQHFKTGTLDLPAISSAMGSAIAQWQTLRPQGYGPFNPSSLQRDNSLVGFHTSYADYFRLHLDRHLSFLIQSGFLSTKAAAEIADEIEHHHALLDLDRGCLVHKDLAFWNILGTPHHITAFIDWDDSISGDPMDDFSLLACFHDHQVLVPALQAYEQKVRLPAEYQRRFWLHLLRNMIVKAVIRVGAGYFNRSGAFFLVNQGVDLRTFTEQRLQTSLDGLRRDLPIASLGTI